MEIKDDLQDNLKELISYYIDSHKKRSLIANKILKLFLIFLTISISISIIGIVGAILSVFL